MNTNPVLWLQAYIIGVLVFLISITAITEHLEWPIVPMFLLMMSIDRSSDRSAQ